MPDDRYWLWLNEVQAGPFTVAQICRLSEDQIDEDEEGSPIFMVTSATLFWSETLGRWERISLMPSEWDRKDGRDKLSEIQSAGIEWVEFLDSGRGDDCEICRKLNGQRFRLSDAPQISPEGCTCEPWSRAALIAVEGP